MARGSVDRVGDWLSLVQLGVSVVAVPFLLIIGHGYQVPTWAWGRQQTEMTSNSGKMVFGPANGLPTRRGAGQSASGVPTRAPVNRDGCWRAGFPLSSEFDPSCVASSVLSGRVGHRPGKHDGTFVSAVDWNGRSPLSTG